MRSRSLDRRFARSPLGRGMRLALSCLVALAVLDDAAAQTSDRSATAAAGSLSPSALRSVVDAVAGDAVRQSQIPDLLVAVSQHGQRQYFAYGASGSGGFSKDTIVEIGSITKTFTATLYAEAVQEGRMAPDASIATYLPASIRLEPCTAAVTVQDLAAFRSGMPLLPSDVPRRLAFRSENDYTVADFYGWVSSWSPSSDEVPDPAATGRAACDLPARYKYSNAGVGLLGLLLENVYREPWDQLVADRITGPIVATSTAVAPRITQRFRIAQGHGENGNEVMPWPRFAWFAAGALRSTAEDMLGFGEAALGHGTVNGSTVPPALTRAFAYSMQPLYQPEGKPFRQGTAVWGLMPIDRDRPERGSFAYKDGGTDGFNSVLIVDTRDDTTIFVVADMAKSGIPALGMRLLQQWSAAGS